jgi:chromosome partitioning protein
MIIVFGGIKGGTGKSTLAFHIATCAHMNNKKIVTIDCDFPQFSFSKYYENRKKNKSLDEKLIWQNHHKITDLTKLPDMIEKDTVYLIDTPGKYDPHITKIHGMADIIISPVNDSFLDIDTIMKLDQGKWAMPGYYYETIMENKKYKKDSMWIVVRNRSTHINSKHKRTVEERLTELSKRINFTLMQGLRERTIFRELFNEGSTVLDVESKKMSLSHLAAKMEVKLLWKTIADYEKTVFNK